MKKIVRLTENDLHNIIIETVISVMENAGMKDKALFETRYDDDDIPLSLRHKPIIYRPEPVSMDYTEVGIPENSEVVDSVDALGLKVFLCHEKYGDYYKVFKALNKTSRSNPYDLDRWSHRAITFKTGDYFAPANSGEYAFSIYSVDAPFVLDTDNGKLYVKGYDEETDQWEYMEANEVFQ